MTGLSEESQWQFWIDIEKAKLISDQEQLERHFQLIKNRYGNKDGRYRLEWEDRTTYGLVEEPSEWQLDYLFEIQSLVIEPLVVYWSPGVLSQQNETTASAKFNKPDMVKSVELVGIPQSYPKERLTSETKMAECLNPSNPVGPNVVKSAGSAGSMHSLLMPAHATIRENEALSSDQLRETPSGLGLQVRSSHRMLSSPMSRLRAKPTPVNNRLVMRKKWQKTLEEHEAKVFNSKTKVSLRKSISHLQKVEENEDDRQVWRNALNFWNELQRHRESYFAHPDDLVMLEKEIKHLYFEFLDITAPMNIHCPPDILKTIHSNLTKVEENLFDEVESYVLAILFAAWSHIVNFDMAAFDTIQRVEITQKLDDKSKYVQYMKKRGILKQKVQKPVVRQAKDPKYDATLLKRIPKAFRDYTIKQILQFSKERELLLKLLAENYAGQDLEYFEDTEEFKEILKTAPTDVEAIMKKIKSKHFNSKYLFGANSPAGKEGQDKIIELGGGSEKMNDVNALLTPESILEAFKYVDKRLMKKWLPMLLGSAEFADLKGVAKKGEDEDDDDDGKGGKKDKGKGAVKEKQVVKEKEQRKSMKGPTVVNVYVGMLTTDNDDDAGYVDDDYDDDDDYGLDYDDDDDQDGGKKKKGKGKDKGKKGGKDKGKGKDTGKGKDAGKGKGKGKGKDAGDDNKAGKKGAQKKQKSSRQDGSLGDEPDESEEDEYEVSVGTEMSLYSLDRELVLATFTAEMFLEFLNSEQKSDKKTK